jgi:four helix bundle protein
MIVTSLDDLRVHQQAVEAADVVAAILERPAFRRQPKLHNQIRDCSARIPALISEGFGKKTDRHCAHFQSLARGEANEIRSHLEVARGRRCIAADECASICARYVSIGKQLTRWIQHLDREDRKHRGVGAPREEEREQRPTAQDQRPTTQNQRRTTQDQLRTTQDQRPTTRDQRPTTQDQRPTAQDQRPGTNGQRPRTNDRRPRTND